MDGYGQAWQHVQTVRRRIRSLRLQAALLAWCALPPLLAWAFVLAEHLGDHAVSTRASLKSGLLAALGVWAVLGLGGFLLIRLGRRWLPGERETALLVGSDDPDVRDRLLNGLQVIEEDRRRPGQYDPGLVAASLDGVLPRLRTQDPRRILPLALRRRALGLGASAWSLAILLLLLGGADARLAARRLWEPQREFRGAPLFQLAVEAAWPDSLHPGRMLDGESLSLRVTARGEALPSEVEVHARPLDAGSAAGTDATWRLPVRMGAARLDGLTLRGSVVLVASALETQLGQVRRVESAPLEVRWLRPPRLDSLAITIHPPAYTRLPVRRVPPEAADFSCPAGSRLELAAFAPRAPRRAWLGGAAGEDSTRTRLELRPDARGARGVITATASRRFTLHLEDDQGLRDPNPLVRMMEVVPDTPPRLRMLAPRDVEGRLDAGLALDLAALGEDDYGLTRLRLAWKVRSRAEQESVPAPDPASLDSQSLPRDWGRRDLPLRPLVEGVSAVSGTGARATAELRWDLAPLNLLPEDELVFYLELWDNDGWQGAKSVRSPLYRYRMPGLEELFAESRDEERDVEREAEELLEKAKENTRQFQELREELRRDPEVTWEKEQRLKQVVKEQEEVARQAGELAQRLDQAQKKADSRNLLSDELRNKLKQLQTLLNEVMSPELLDKLRKAAEEALKNPQAAPSQRPQADMEEVLRKMEQQLDRFLSVLEQMKLEQRLEELARRAEALLEQQRQLDRDLDKTGQPREKSGEQAARQQEAESLRQELERVQDEFGQRPDFPSQSLDQARRQMKDKRIPPRLGEMKEQLAANQTPSSQDREQMDQDLGELADQLQQALQQSRQQAMAELGKEIDRLVQELLAVSRQQEAITGGLAGLGARSAKLPLLAEETLENQLGVRAAARGVQELLRKSLHVSPATLTELGAADQQLTAMLEDFHERQTGRLRTLSPDAMGRVNQAILQLKEAERQMNQSGSSSGLQQMLEKMAQAASRQQCLNGQCNNLMSLKPGQSQKPMSISFGEAKGEQGSIREDVESLQKQQGSEGKPQLGDLGQMASDMREVEKDLANETYTERTKKLQERILGRLLDAQRSVRRQDEEKKRESRTAQDLRAAPPPPVELQRERALERELQRALQGGYTPEMQELIRDYFRALDSGAGSPATAP